MLLKNRIPIIYAGGAYGSYLFWVLNNFTDIGLQNSPELPFTASGSSHNQSGLAGWSYEQWTEFSTSSSNQRFFRLHYYIGELSIQDAVNDIASKVDYLITVRAPKRYWALLHNNCILKTDKGYPKFDPDDGANYREQYSYRGFTAEEYRLALEMPDNAIVVDVNDLLYNFELTLLQIIRDLNVSLTTDISVIMQNHNIMISKQKYLNKSENISLFLDNFVNRIDCDLPDDCSIIDEAYIQYYLRNELDLNLRCNDIGNNFPKTVKELWKYAYTIG